MGREVRRVPPNWKHPTIERYGRVDNQPMRDRPFDQEFQEWLLDFDRVRRGELTEVEQGYWPRGLPDWFKDYPSPDPAYYRPWKDEEATWFQLWETVSEGTPVSPPFATKEELAQHLAAHGDEWDEKRRRGGWGIERARAFVEAGWAPSMVVINNPGEATVILDSKDIPLAMEERRL